MGRPPIRYKEEKINEEYEWIKPKIEMKEPLMKETNMINPEMMEPKMKEPNMKKEVM